MRILLSVIAVLLLTTTLSAQTITTVTATRFRLSNGDCTISSGTSGSGTPENVIVGSTCDLWFDANTGELWKKLSGVATMTGWSRVPGLTLTNTWTGGNFWTVGGNFSRTAAGDTAVNVMVSGESYPRVNVAASGVVLFGPGNVVGDTNLYRSAASVLRTDDAFHVDLGIRDPDYVSQLTAWAITAAGAADFRYLYTDELHAKAFIADLEQALAGGQIIAKSVAMLGATFTAPAAGAITTLTVKDLPSAADMAVFEVNDHVRLRSFSRAGGSLSITDCWGVVTGYADGADGIQTWTFTRGTGVNAGAMAAGATVAVEAIVLDYGTSGMGYYEVNAIDGLYGINSPYAQVVSWSGASPIAANQTLRARLGKLTGITAASNEYGLIAGTYAATNGQYFRASNTAFELHGIDLSLWDSTTKTVYIDHAVPSIALGNPLPTGYSTGAGIWMGKDTAYKFRVGNPAGGYLGWDGTTLTAAGWTIGATAIQDLAGVVGMSSAVTAGDDIRFWAGDATPASAEFRVTEAGALTATSATITGAITATTISASVGTIGGFTLGANTLSSGTDADYVAMSSAGTNAFWAGDLTFADAEFSVTAAGALKATSATLAGTLSAASGSVTVDANGVGVAGGTAAAWDAVASYHFTGLDEGVSQVGMRAYDAGTQTHLLIQSYVYGGNTAYVDFTAYQGGTGTSVQMNLVSIGPAGNQYINFNAGTSGWIQTSNDIRPTTTNGAGLGTTDYRWSAVWWEDDEAANQTTTAALYPMVSESGRAKVKTGLFNNAAKACAAGADITFNVEYGLIKNITCTTPAPAPAAGGMVSQMGGVR